MSESNDTDGRIDFGTDVDGTNGPKRLVPPDAAVERAARSTRLRRSAERELSLDAQVALLQHRLAQDELRLARLQRRADRPR